MQRGILYFTLIAANFLLMAFSAQAQVQRVVNPYDAKRLTPIEIDMPKWFKTNEATTRMNQIQSLGDYKTMIVGKQNQKSDAIKADGLVISNSATKNFSTESLNNENKLSANKPITMALADTVLFEPFDGPIPANWANIDRDKQTVAPTFEAVSVFTPTTHWVSTTRGLNGRAAASTSFHANTSVPADDWLILPPVQIPTSGQYLLEWMAAARYLVADGYQVRLAVNPPATLDTNNLASTFSTVLFSIPAEQWGTFISRKVNLDTYAGQTVRIAFRNNSANKRMLYIDNILIGRRNDYDAQAYGIVGLPPTCQLGLNEKIKVYLYNPGGTTLTNVPVKVVVKNGATSVTYSATKASLVPDKTDSIEVSGIDLSAAGSTYTAYAYVDYPTEENRKNDTTPQITMYHLAPINPATPYRYGFEPTEDSKGWVVNNTNGDNARWNIFNNVNFSALGVGLVASGFDGNYSNQMNDWLYSRCLSLTAGKQYRVYFKFRRALSTSVKRLEVKLGTQQSVASMTQAILNLNNITIDSYTEASATFTASSSGVFYLGFRDYSPAGSGWILMDDIILQEVKTNDLAALEVTAPDPGCNLGGTQSISAKIRNMGTANQTSVNAQLIVNGLPATTISVGNVNASETKTINFVGSFFPTPNEYQIQVKTLLAGDEISANDTTPKARVNHIAPWPLASKPFFNNFEDFSSLEGWQFFDENTDGISWRRITQQSDAFSGDNFMIYGSFNGSNGPAATANDYLVTPCLSLVAGTKYDVTFYTRVLFSDAPHKLKVVMGTGQLPSQLTQTLLSIDTIHHTEYKKYSVRFTATTSGSHYIGLRDQSAGGQHTVVMLEDLTIKKAEDKDVEIVNIETPGYRCGLSANESIKVTIRNAGVTPLDTIKVYASVNGTPTPMVTTTNLAVGQLRTLSISNLDFSALNTLYNVKATAVHNADTNKINDTSITAIVLNVPPISLAVNDYSETFDSISYTYPEWRFIDRNNDDVKFSRIYDYYTGGGYIKYDTDDWVNANDWAITPCFELLAGQKYEVSFNFAAGFLDLSTFKFYVGKKPEPDSLNVLLIDKPLVTEWTFTDVAKAVFVPTQSGTYYFGWETKSSTPMGSLYIDNFNVVKQKDKDVALVDINNPKAGGNICNSPSLTIGVKLANLGTDTLYNVPFTVTAENNGLVQQATGVAAIILPGDTILAHTTTTINTSTGGYFTLRGFTSLPTDENKSNDSLQNNKIELDLLGYTFKVLSDISVPFVETFEGDSTDYLKGNSSFTSDRQPFSGAKAFEITILNFDFFGIKKQPGRIYTGLVSGITTTTHITMDISWNQLGLFDVPTPIPFTSTDSIILFASVGCGNYSKVGAITPSQFGTGVGYRNIRFDVGSLAGQANVAFMLLLKAPDTANMGRTIFIDNFTIENISPIDVKLVNPKASLGSQHYTSIPYKHQVDGFIPSVMVLNNGLSPITVAGVNAVATPYAFNAVSGNVGTLQPGQTKLAQYIFPIVATQPSVASVTFSVPTISGETNTTNNTASVGFVSDTVYSRDKNDATSSTAGLYFDASAGSNGRAGQIFEIYQTDTLTSVSFYVAGLTANTTVKAFVSDYSTTTNLPTTLLASSNNYTIDISGANKWHTVKLNRALSGNSTGKKYVVGLNQVSGQMRLGYTTTYYEPFSAYATTSGSSWFALDNSTLNGATLYLRANFGSTPWLVTNIENKAEKSDWTVRVFPNPSNGNFTLSSQISGFATIFDLTGKELMRFVLPAGESNIQMPQSGKGIYILKLTNNISSQTVKLLID